MRVRSKSQVIPRRTSQKYQTFDRAAGIEDRNGNAVLKDVKSNFRKRSKKAKQKYYRKIIDGLVYQNIFQAVKWLSMIRQYTTPLIQRQNGSLAVDNQENKKELRKALFTPPASTDQENIEVPNLQEETRNSPVDWHAYTMHEIEAAIFQAGTSASLDGILPLFIKKAWLVYKKEVTCLFQRCLEEGYYSNVFKNATLYALPKPKKRLRLLSRSYCFILLLSCLGKILERIVARWLAYIALKDKLFSQLHFGITLGSLAVNAVFTLIYDIRQAF